MSTLTLRCIKGDFVVTGPDIEPAKFKTRREAKDWCQTRYPGSPIQEIVAKTAKRLEVRPPRRRIGTGTSCRLRSYLAAAVAPLRLPRNSSPRFGGAFLVVRRRHESRVTAFREFGHQKGESLRGGQPRRSIAICFSIWRIPGTRLPKIASNLQCGRSALRILRPPRE